MSFFFYCGTPKLQTVLEVIADHSTTEFAQKAVPTEPAGCHDSDRDFENALLFHKVCRDA